jgi:hypothetical protein
MKTPMSAAFVRQREPVATFFRGVLLRIEAFIDHDPAFFEEYRAENVGFETDARTRYAKQPMHVIEFDAELEMLLDNILDRNSPDDFDSARLLVFGE